MTLTPINLGKMEPMDAPSGHQFVEQFRNGEDIVSLYRFPNGYGAELTVALLPGNLGMDSFAMRITRYASPNDQNMIFEYLPGTWERPSMPPFAEFAAELDRIAALTPWQEN